MKILQCFSLKALFSACSVCVACNVYTVQAIAIVSVFITLTICELLSQDSSVVSVPDNDPWISIPDGSYTVQDEHIKVEFTKWAS